MRFLRLFVRYFPWALFQRHIFLDVGTFLTLLKDRVCDVIYRTEGSLNLGSGEVLCINDYTLLCGGFFLRPGRGVRFHLFESDSFITQTNVV